MPRYRRRDETPAGRGGRGGGSAGPYKESRNWGHKGTGGGGELQNTSREHEGKKTGWKMARLGSVEGGATGHGRRSCFLDVLLQKKLRS